MLFTFLTNVYLFGLKIVSIERKKCEFSSSTSELSSLLNQVIDIRNCPKARGKLRKLQIADTLLLKIFHNVCKKHKLDYVLEAGTLLGAARHKGFIPWDDDLDISIIYDDYERLIEILKKEFEKTNLILYGVEKTRFGNDTLRITHKNFESLNLDIFYVHPCSMTGSSKSKIKSIWESFHKRYYDEFKNISKIENFENLKKWRIKLNSEFEKQINTCSIKECNSFVHKISSDFWFIEKKDFYPRKLVSFEDFEFFVPNNSYKILEDMYGDWMSFPPTLRHHGSMFLNFNEDKIDTIIEELKKYLTTKFNY